MRRHRRHSTAFKRQIVEEYLAGATLNALSKEHDICRHLIEKCEAGEFDAEKEAADTLDDYQAMIAALERLAGRQALEIEFLKGALSSMAGTPSAASPTGSQSSRCKGSRSRPPAGSRCAAVQRLRRRHEGRDQRPFAAGQIACVARRLPPIPAAGGFGPGYRRLSPVWQPDGITTR